LAWDGALKSGAEIRQALDDDPCAALRRNRSQTGLRFIAPVRRVPLDDIDAGQAPAETSVAPIVRSGGNVNIAYQVVGNGPITWSS
jgi:hypothetical protein